MGALDPLLPVALYRGRHSHRALDPARTGVKARAAVTTGAPHFVDVLVQHG
jgi:hypothetical protein